MDALQAVLAANATGSFTAAADALRITHGAVSRRVAAVEHWAGITLFERHGRGVRLTFEGQHLIASIERAMMMLDDARASRRNPDIEAVRVGVLPSFARLWLMPNLRRLEGEPPDLRIELDVDHRLMTLSDARIAIRYGGGEWPGVTATPLFDETLYPVAAPSIATELGTDADPVSLLDYPLMYDPSDIHWRAWFAVHGIAFERRPQDRVIIDYDLTLQAVAEGHAITLLRDPFGKTMADRLGLRRLSPSSIASNLRFYLVTKSGPHHAVVERLIERMLAIGGSSG